MPGQRIDEYSWDWHECPVCGDPGVNQLFRSRYYTRDNVELWEGVAQEGGIKIPMRGEMCNCLFFVCIGQHKGSMLIRIEKTNQVVYEALDSQKTR